LATAVWRCAGPRIARELSASTPCGRKGARERKDWRNLQLGGRTNRRGESQAEAFTWELQHHPVRFVFPFPQPCAFAGCGPPPRRVGPQFSAVFGAYFGRAPPSSTPHVATAALAGRASEPSRTGVSESEQAPDHCSLWHAASENRPLAALNCSTPGCDNHRLRAAPFIVGSGSNRLPVQAKARLSNGEGSILVHSLPHV
jgi:hypothetical protein